MRYEGTMITGASDDLIEVEGEIIEEFSSFDCQNGLIACSDGTLLKVFYDKDGLWRFNLLYKGDLFDRKDEGSQETDENDKIYFKPGLKWVVFNEDGIWGKKC